jgi:hypothetical protein
VEGRRQQLPAVAPLFVSAQLKRGRG